jgi:hypothetical protein
MQPPLACPCCRATRGIKTHSVYTLANGHRRRLRMCRHCGSPIRTIQEPGHLETLAQEVITQATAPIPQKLTADQVLEIRNAVARGMSQSRLAAQFSVRRQTINQIVTGRTWRLVGGPISTRHCFSCAHYEAGRCAFGFPEAIEEPSFAGECSLFEASQSSSRA